MIFVTVGAQMPFDRMIRAVDEWAAQRGRSDVLAQIGDTDWRPQHIEWRQFIEPEEFERLFDQADAIVAHAGTGSIITAMQFGKPVLVMPRRAALHETRNDHQVATADRFKEMFSIAVAYDEHEMALRLDELDSLENVSGFRDSASDQLINCLREFFEDE